MVIIDEVELELRKVRRLVAPSAFCYGAEQAIPLFIREIGRANVEKVALICLSSSFHINAFSIVSIGKTGETVFDIAQIIRIALLSNAEKIIVAHNHPVGRVRPSEPDVKATQKLATVCGLLGIQLIDSIVVNGDEGFSLRESVKSSSENKSE